MNQHRSHPDAFRWTVVGLDLRTDGWYATTAERAGEWVRVTPNIRLSREAVIATLCRRGHEVGEEVAADA